MAIAAFKSSSRRGNQSSSSSSTPTTAAATTTTTTTRAPPIRRSRSVSAFSRNTSFDFSNEFLNKRDNPLFDQTSKPNQTAPVVETSPPVRGRSVARNGEANRKDKGRSVSRVDTGRRSTRSASQCPVSRRHFNYSTSESEADGKVRNGLKLGGSNRKDGFFRRPDKDVIHQEKDMRRWSSQHSTIDVSDRFDSTSSGLQTQNFDDAVSTASSGFGCDEKKTIKPVCVQNSVQRDQLGGSDIYETVRSEVRRAISEIQIDLESAIQVSNATAITVTDMADIHPDLLSSGSIELALETRREYTKKLEEAEERARRLRADLAVEEHRVRELDRILREVLPYPKTPIIPKSRPLRKSSIERKRMSKRLAEDAKAYFDECVSLSTFDSSDFSSQEDPPLSMVGPLTPSRLTEQSGTREQPHDIHYVTMQPPASIDSEEAIHEQVSSTADSKETDSKHCFSFAQKPSEGTTAQQDIQQYIKKFEKSVSKLPTMRSSYGDMCDYSFQSSAESLLIDRVMLRSRIESGRFLLCGGGNFWSS